MMTEKLDALMYMVENGWELPLPMDEMVVAYSVDDLWAMLQERLDDEEAEG